MSQTWVPPSTPNATYRRTLRRRNDPAAGVALALAVSSLFVWILPSIVGFAVASGAKRNIKASDGTLAGKAMATTSQTICVLTLLGASGALVGIYFA